MRTIGNSSIRIIEGYAHLQVDVQSGLSNGPLRKRRYRTNKRLTCRTLSPSCCAASCCRSVRLTNCCITSSRSTGLLRHRNGRLCHRPSENQKGDILQLDKEDITPWS